jgi:hypothetical protein
MARILKRPMFRRGGMPSSEGVAAIRPKYMGGGMSGIMTGINPTAGLTPRVGYKVGTPPLSGFAGGAPIQPLSGFVSNPSAVVNTPASNVFTSGSSTSGGQVVKEAGEKIDRMRRLGQKFTSGFKNLKGSTSGILNALFRGSSSGALPPGVSGPLNPIRAGLGTSAAAAIGSVSGPAIIAAMNKPKTYEELDFVKKYEEGLYTGSISDETSSAEDIEAFDKERVRLSDTEKFTPIEKTSDIFSSQEEIDKKIKENKKELDPLDKIGGEKEIKDEESALMKAYKEYAPIFEKELGVSDDDTKKQLYLQLAKFGAGVAAQPGGDLVGAIGKAALPAIEGAGETVKEQSTAKRQAKLLALQTAISEGKPGPIATAIKDIAKIYKVSNKEAAAIYEKWNVKNSAGNPVQEKRLETLATNQGVNPDGFIRNINKLLKSEDADLIGKFNKKLPMNDGIPDPDKMVDKEYYIGLGGELYRVDKSVEPTALLEPGDPGFKDSKKEK